MENKCTPFKICMEAGHCPHQYTKRNIDKKIDSCHAECVVSFVNFCCVSVVLLVLPQSLRLNCFELLLL